MEDKDTPICFNNKHSHQDFRDYFMLEPEDALADPRFVWVINHKVAAGLAMQMGRPYCYWCLSLYNRMN